VHTFLEGTTCRDLVRELGHSPPVDSNEMFDIVTSFASGEEAAGAIFDAKRASTWMTRPRRAASPGSPSRSTSRAKKAISRATKRACRDATTTGTRPSQLTQLEGVLERLLEAPTYSMTC
jgi:hypothetical protein